VLLTLAFYLFSKYRKAPTTESFLSTCFLCSKFAVLFLAYLIDTRIFAWYVILFSATLVTLQGPKFDWGDSVEVLSPPTLAPYSTAGQKKPPLLVFFFASWNQACTDLIPTFAKLAERYSCNSLRFAKVDVSQWPELAKQHKVDTSAMSSQLPALLLFEGGEVSQRLPPEGSKPVLIDEAGIIAFFQLDGRLAGTYKSKSS